MWALGGTDPNVLGNVVVLLGVLGGTVEPKAGPINLEFGSFGRSA